jgi:integrase
LRNERENIRHSTLIGYEKILKYNLVPAFGKLSLTELRRKHLRDWAASHPNMSAKRMRNVLSPLRIALDAAVERELIEVNPLVGFRIRKRSNGKAEDVDPFSSDEPQRF